MRKAGLILIALGVLLTFCAGGWLTWNEEDERRADTAAQTALQALTEALDAETSGGKLTENPKTDVQNPAEETKMPVIWVDGVAYIGTLSIPELGLELPVQAECTEEGLKNSPCRYWGTLESRDLVIAGHNYKRHFTPVKNLKPGAKILFRDAESRDYEFVVSAVETVAGTDVEAMIANSGDWDMTLFTCTYGGRDRVAIRCVRTDE